MLIDQMKEHPEEFKGYAGKFTNLLDKARDSMQGEYRQMSKRDATAIMAAAETHLYEVWLAEDVLTSIMQPKPEVETSWGTTTGRSANRLGVWQGAAPSAIYSGNSAANSMANIGSSNTATSQYGGQEHQMELARYKMGMQKLEMERQRKQEIEYAMRNTKPFKSFI